MQPMNQRHQQPRPSHFMLMGAFAFLCCVLMSLNTQAQGNLYYGSRSESEARIGELSDPDRQFMDRQKRALDDLARRYMGRQFSGFNRVRDTELMQTMLDRGLVRAEQVAELQGMGYVLGDYLVKEQRLRWISYEDSQGRSRALAVPGKPDYVFPSTIISSRHIAGSKIDVDAVYQQLVDEVQAIRQKIYIR